MAASLIRAVARCLLATLLLAALAPAISHTLGTTRGVGARVEVCASNGMVWVPLSASGGARIGDGTDPVSPDERLHALDHCGYCALAAERFAPLIPAWPMLVASTGQLPAPQHVSCPHASRWTLGAIARGPPLLH